MCSSRFKPMEATVVTSWDVEAAKKLFAEAGVDPKELKIQIWTNERKERVDMATIIQAQLKELGIVAEIKVLEWGAYI